MAVQEIVVVLATSAIGVLSGYIGVQLALKKVLNKDKILEFSEEILSNGIDTVLEDSEIQKKVYTIGVLIGNGLKTGFGLQKRSGKMSIQDLIGMGVSYFLGQRQGLPMQNPLQMAPSTDEKLKSSFKS